MKTPVSQFGRFGPATIIDQRGTRIMWREQLKLPFALTTAMVITLALFGLMQSLIAGSPGTGDSDNSLPSIRFAAIEIKPPPPPRERVIA